MGSESGDIPAATTAGDKTCMITATDNVVATPVSTSITIAVSATVPAGTTNTPPTLTKTDTDVDVTEAGVDASNAAVAGDAAANGSLAATDADTGQTATLQGCADADASTACTGFRDATTAGLAITGVYGAFTLMADGAWTYMLVNTDSDTNALAAGATATDTLRVRADDGVGNTTDMAGMGRSRHSTTLAVEVTITGTNDAPVAVAGAGGGIPDTIAATQGEVFNFMLGAASTRFTDPESDTLSYGTLSGLPGTIAFDATTGTFSGNAPATGTPTITVTVNDGNGGEVSETFTLNLLAVPMPVDQATAETDSVELTPDVFGFQDDDARLESVTITSLPNPATEGRLLLNGNPVMANTPIVAAALANLEFVPVNRKVSAAGTPTATYMLTYTTAGTNGGTSSGTVNIVITFSDSRPALVPKTDDDGQPQMGILDMEAALDDEFDYRIRTGFAPDDDFNPVDRDDTALTFTATYAIRGGAATPVPAPGTGTFWLKFDGTSFSGTPPEDAEGMVYTISVTATDVGANAVTDPFDLTVGANNPIFAISSVKVDLPGSRVVVTVVREDETLTEPANVSVRVYDDADGIYVDGMVNHIIKFEKDVNEGMLVVPLRRSIGPGARITAEIVAGMGYEASMIPGMASRNELVEANDKRVRGQNVKDGLSGFARAMGWSMAEAVSKRSSIDRHRGEGGDQVDMDALTQILTSKLRGKLTGSRAGSPGTTGTGDIMAVIDTFNDRYAGGTTDASASALNLASEAAGQGIYGAFVPADGAGGNVGAISGTATDFRGWLTELGVGRVTRTLDGMYSAVEDGIANRLPEGMSVWSEIKRDDITYGDIASYDGEFGSARLGLEKRINDNFIMGLAISVFDGNLGLSNSAFSIMGKLDIAGWNMNPYLLWSGESVRYWMTVGLGQGDLDYMDEHRTIRENDSASIDTNMLALGAEYDLASWDNMELLGRLEAMNLQLNADGADLGMFTEQSSRVSGMRGELEAGWPLLLDAGAMRPYLTLGYRWDGGDGEGGSAIEYGAGISMQMQHFSFDGMARTQVEPDDSDYERTSYALSFSYDSNHDEQGMMLMLSQDYGVAEMDPFAQYTANTAFIGNNSAGTDSLNIHAGYGFVLENPQRSDRNGMLTFHFKTDFNQGDQGKSEYGLKLETSGRRNSVALPTIWDLLYTRQSVAGVSGAGGQSRDAVLLKLTRQF